MEVSTAPNTRGWFSVYLYPTASLDSALAELGRFIAELKAEAAPEVNWFFIRYQDRFGPHLRLRVECSNSSMRSAAVAKLERAFGLSGLADAGTRHGITSSGLLQRARQVRYRPEVTRYGGPERIAFSERFFRSSSEWVLQHADLLGVEYARRLLTAGIGAYLLLRVAGREKTETARLASAIVNSWVYTLRQRQVWGGKADESIAARWAQDRLAWSRGFALAEKYFETADAQSPLSDWVAECQARIADLDRSLRPNSKTAALQRQSVIQSWTHMHLNRMGITNADEALIAFGVAQQFETSNAI